jgi:site-specific DNA-cytosine methylase
MIVLSLFDGISCGRFCLDRLREPVVYYASEINEPAQFVSKNNYPDIIRLGDVTNWRQWPLDWSSIDLLIAGSPCQGFSSAGKAGGTKAIINGETVLIDSRSKYVAAKSVGAEFLSQSHLFWEFVLILDHIKAHNPRVRFMLENVKMSGNNMDMITAAVGVQPVFINSALVSAQNRQRYYWCNWKVPQPADTGVMLTDILEINPRNTVVMTDTFVNRQKGRKCLVDNFNRKASSLSAMEYVKNGRQGDYIAIRPAAMVGRKIREDGKRDDYSDLPIVQMLEVGEGYKARCLSTVQKDTLYTDMEPGRYVAADEQTRYRKFTPIECERLQGLSDNYTAGVSNTQRYMMIGNGWQCDTIVHIFFWLLVDMAGDK